MALTVSGFLDDLQYRLLELLGNARDKLVIEAARQMKFCIDDARNAFSDVADQKIDKVDLAVSKQLDQLKKLSKNVLKSTGDQFDKFSGKIASLVSVLPFASDRPQLVSMKPCSFVLSKRSWISCVFTGYFPQIGNPQCKPTLVFNGHRLPLTGTLNKLQCNIKKQQFPSNISPYVFTAQLQLPWEEGVLKTKKVAVFDVSFAVLPDSPGTITIQCTKKIVVINKQTRSIKMGNQSSSRRGEKKDIDRSYNPQHYVTEGYTVTPGSSNVTFHSRGTKGYRPHLYRDPDTPDAWRIVTRYDGGGVTTKSGIASNITLSFEEQQTTHTPKWYDSAENLKWGESKDIDCGKGSWKVLFKPYDGSGLQELVEGNSGNSFISVQVVDGANGKKIRLTAESVNNVQWAEAVATICQIQSLPNLPPVLPETHVSTKSTQPPKSSHVLPEKRNSNESTNPPNLPPVLPEKQGSNESTKSQVAVSQPNTQQWTWTLDRETKDLLFAGVFSVFVFGVAGVAAYYNQQS